MKANELQIGEVVRVDESATLTGITKGVIEGIFGTIVAVKEKESVVTHLVNVKHVYKLKEE